VIDLEDSGFLDRVLPFQPLEPGEIGIAAVQRAVVLNRESGKMSIAYEVSDSSTVAKHALKNYPMMIARVNDSNTRLVQPALHALNRFRYCKRTPMQPWIGADTNEGREHRPAQTNRTRTTELLVPPNPRWLVMLGKTVLGIEQNVGVDENQT